MSKIRKFLNSEDLGNKKQENKCKAPSGWVMILQTTETERVEERREEKDYHPVVKTDDCRAATLRSWHSNLRKPEVTH